MLKKMKINNQSYTVTDMNDYTECTNLYDAKSTAIETKAGVVLPILSKTETQKVGIRYDDNPRTIACLVNKPSQEQLSEYSSDNIIDYGKCKDVRDIINTNQLVRNIENDILTDKDNIYTIPVSGNEEPAMAALKNAINSKEVDMYKYESRFKQFQNDMRLMKTDSITLAKLVNISNALDIEAELILRDKSDCPNPMNKEIRTILTQRSDT